MGVASFCLELHYGFILRQIKTGTLLGLTHANFFVFVIANILKIGAYAFLKN